MTESSRSSLVFLKCRDKNISVQGDRHNPQLQFFQKEKYNILRIINHRWRLVLSTAKIFTINRQKREKFIKIKKINRNVDEIFHGR